MSDVDSAVRKTRAKAKAAENEQVAAERAASAAEERARHAKLALKKAKKESRKATKSARKARKAAEAAQQSFAKAAARVARAEADVAKAQRAQKKRVTKETTTTKSAAAKVVQKETGRNGDGPKKVASRKVTGQKRVHRTTMSRAARRPRDFRVQVPAPATVPAISALEPSDGSETFLLGQSDLT
jgi:colicin import membrane protein